jgi:hypothetical protein
MFLSSPSLFLDGFHSKKRQSFLRNGCVFFLMVCLLGKCFLNEQMCSLWNGFVFFKEYGHVLQCNVFFLKDKCVELPFGTMFPCPQKKKDWQCPWPILCWPKFFQHFTFFGLKNNLHLVLSHFVQRDRGYIYEHLSITITRFIN